MSYYYSKWNPCSYVCPCHFHVEIARPIDILYWLQDLQDLWHRLRDVEAGGGSFEVTRGQTLKFRDSKYWKQLTFISEISSLVHMNATLIYCNKIIFSVFILYFWSHFAYPDFFHCQLFLVYQDAFSYLAKIKIH